MSDRVVPRMINGVANYFCLCVLFLSLSLFIRDAFNAPSVFLSVCLCLSGSLSLCLFVFLSKSTHLPIHLPVCLSIRLSIYLSIYLSMSTEIFLPNSGVPLGVRVCVCAVRVRACFLNGKDCTLRGLSASSLMSGSSYYISAKI